MNVSTSRLNKDPARGRNPAKQAKERHPSGHSPPIPNAFKEGPPAGDRLHSTANQVEAGTGRLLESVGRHLEELGHKLEAAPAGQKENTPPAFRASKPAASPSRINNRLGDSLSVATIFMVSILVLGAGIVLNSVIVAVIGFLAVLCAAELYYRLLLV